MQKVLIADMAGDWRELLEQSLGQQYLLRSCHDGLQILDLIDQFQPDVLILDLMLSGIDGLGVLKALQSHPAVPRIIVTGRHFSDFVNRALDQYPVDSIFMKPCAVQGIHERVSELLAPDAAILPICPDPLDYITSLLVRLGIRTSQQGFRFLRWGILLLMDDPTQQLTKSLYPAIAAEFGTSKENVEKALRTAVTTAWRNRSDQIWRSYFPPSPSGQIPKPTAGQFLRRLTDVVSSICRKHA